MTNGAVRTLYRTAAVIFEELCFLLPSPVDRSIGGDAPAAGAAVAFHGPYSGILLVRVSREVVPILSANMLGDDQQPDEWAGRDAVGEIANVICGNVLPAITSSPEVFHIDPPRYFDGPVPADLACFPASVTEVHLGLDSGTADVTLFVSQTGRMSSG